MSQESAHRHGDRPDHDHYTLLYESLEEQFASVAPFVREGLENDEKCIYLYHDHAAGDVSTALRERGVAVDAAVKSDDLSIRPAREFYLSEGHFAPDRVIDALERTISNALDAGCDGLRLVGETGWALDHDVAPGLLEEYEHMVEDLFPRDAFVGLCQYDRSRFPSAYLDAALRTHPTVLRDVELKPNLYYERPEERNAAGITPETIDRKLRTVSDCEPRTAVRDRDGDISRFGTFARRLREAECEEVRRHAVEVVSENLDTAVCSLWSYDDETRALEPQTTRTDRPAVDGRTALEAVGELAWEAFVEKERREVAVDADGPFHAVVVPLGRHGVFVVGTRGTELGGSDLDFVEATCAQTEAVLDVHEYERVLEEKDAELTEKDERLARASDVNTVIREISQSLLDASSRDEIGEAVCEHLVRETPVSFAWFGTCDAATDALEPRWEAGDHREYLDAVSFDDRTAGREPSELAVRSQETRVVDDTYDEPPLANWRQQALKRDFRSVVSLPVSFDGSSFGVLSLYAGTSDAFDEEIRTILEELGDLIAYAINGLERKQALVTKQYTELELRITDAEIALAGFVDATGCTVAVEGVVPDSADGFRMFATFRDVSLEEVRAFATESPTITDLTLISEGDGAHSWECVLTDRCFVATLLDHNTVPQTIRVEDGSVNLVLRLPQGKSVREFVELCESKYADIELLRRRDRERSVQSISEIATELEDELSERQLEVLRIAYRSGYFEQPRDRTAVDIADSLDVTHPTVTRHLREAERRIFAMLFDEA